MACDKSATRWKFLAPANLVDLRPGHQTLVNMTIWSGTETILKRSKNGKNWDQDFHPNNVIVAKLGILLLHVHDQIHHPED